MHASRHAAEAGPEPVAQQAAPLQHSTAGGQAQGRGVQGQYKDVVYSCCRGYAVLLLCFDWQLLCARVSTGRWSMT